MWTGWPCYCTSVISQGIGGWTILPTFFPIPTFTAEHLPKPSPALWPTFQIAKERCTKGEKPAHAHISGECQGKYKIEGSPADHTAIHFPYLSISLPSHLRGRHLSKHLSFVCNFTHISSFRGQQLSLFPTHPPSVKWGARWWFSSWPSEANELLRGLKLFLTVLKANFCLPLHWVWWQQTAMVTP